MLGIRPGRQIAPETHRDRPGPDLGQTGRDHEPGRTVNPSDIPMTMSRIFADEVKCVSTCGVCGIPSPLVALVNTHDRPSLRGRRSPSDATRMPERVRPHTPGLSCSAGWWGTHAQEWRDGPTQEDNPVGQDPESLPCCSWHLCCLGEVLLRGRATEPGTEKEGAGLWTIALIPLVLWALGMVSSYTAGGLVHLLLVIAVI
jgi:hypothetical protein